jgi:hypothetical protein
MVSKRSIRKCLYNFPKWTNLSWWILPIHRDHGEFWGTLSLDNFKCFCGVLFSSPRSLDKSGCFLRGVWFMVVIAPWMNHYEFAPRGLRSMDHDGSNPAGTIPKLQQTVSTSRTGWGRRWMMRNLLLRLTICDGLAQNFPRNVENM